MQRVRVGAQAPEICFGGVPADGLALN